MMRLDYISGRERAETSTGLRRGAAGAREQKTAVFPLMHPTDDKTPQTIHACVVAVLRSDVVARSY